VNIGGDCKIGRSVHCCVCLSVCLFVCVHFAWRRYALLRVPSS